MARLLVPGGGGGTLPDTDGDSDEAWLGVVADDADAAAACSCLCIAFVETETSFSPFLPLLGGGGGTLPGTGGEGELHAGLGLFADGIDVAAACSCLRIASIGG